MRTIELAGLSAIVGGRDTTTDVRSLVILLHGYGAPGSDLVPLANEIQAPSGSMFLFPQGSLRLGLEDPSMGEGRAWWPIDLMRLQVAMMTRQYDMVAEQLAPGLSDAVDGITRFVTAAGDRYRVALDRIMLGGFSQGAILGLEVALRNRWSLGGLLLFSASLIDDRGLADRARSLGQLSCVLSHGQLDPILPFSRAEQLHAGLLEAGWSVDWVPFVGGHGIPPEALSATEHLMTRKLG